MSKRSIAVIINPVAGKGKTIEILPIIKEMFDKTNLDINVKYSVSKTEGEISKIANTYWKQGFSEFISIGGDGTLSEIINGLEYDQIRIPKISIIPAGTGNDFVRSSQSETDVRKIINNVLNEKGMIIDVGVVNDFYFVNTCSFGIDGPITEDTGKYKKIIPNRFSYFYSTIKNGITFKAKPVHVVIDNKAFYEKMLLIVVGNGRFAGGGMKLCPGADLSDGLLDVSMVTNVSVMKFMKEISSVYSGKFIDLKEVYYEKGKEININVETGEYLINADGNIIGLTPAKLKIIEKALFIYI